MLICSLNDSLSLAISHSRSTQLLELTNKSIIKLLSHLPISVLLPVTCSLTHACVPAGLLSHPPKPLHCNTHKSPRTVTPIRATTLVAEVCRPVANPETLPYVSIIIMMHLSGIITHFYIIWKYIRFICKFQEVRYFAKSCGGQLTPELLHGSATAAITPSAGVPIDEACRHTSGSCHAVVPRLELLCRWICV